METEILELQMASFRLGDKLFAIDIMRIREIVLPHRISALPRASKILDGMINLRGVVIPVMNLRSRFDMPVLFSSAGKLMIVSIAGRPVALAVDDVDEVLEVKVKNIVQAPDMIGEVWAEYLIGVCLDSDNLYMILNIDALFTPAEHRELGRFAGEFQHAEA